MKLDKIFKDDVTNWEKIMTFFLLTIGIIITILGLIKGLSTIDSKYYVLIASLVGLIISGFAISGKLFQDIKSGKTQESILDTSIATLDKSRLTLETATQNFSLTQNIDSSTTQTKKISVEIDKNVTLLKEQNIKIEILNKEIDKSLSTVKQINLLQAKEIEKQKFPFPEKLYVGLELNFKLSFNLDYNELFKTYASNDKSIIFQVSSYNKEFEEAFIKTTQILGILQLNGYTVSDNLFNFSNIYPIKYREDRKVNLEDLTEVYIPKKDNSAFGHLYYDGLNKKYNLTIVGYPILFSKSSKLTSILDLDNLEFEISINFIPTIPSSDKIPFVQLLNDNKFIQKIYFKTSNTTIAKLENIVIEKNTENSNVIKGRIKLLNN